MRWIFWAGAVICASALLVGQQARLGEKPKPQVRRERQRTLVVADKRWTADNTDLVSFLNTAGHTVTVVNIDENRTAWPQIREHTQPMYENVIIGDVAEGIPFASSKDFSNEVMEMVGGHGGSVVVLGVGSSSRRAPALNILATLRVRYTANEVKDHIKNIDGDPSRITVAVTEQGVFADPRLSPAALFEYSGRGFAVVEKEGNALVQPAVVAWPTTYTELHNGQLLSDQRMLLIFALETRSSGGRIVVSGDANFCSRARWRVNESLCKAMITWSALEAGVLDWSNFKHMHANGTAPGPLYTQRDSIRVSIDLHERRNGSWDAVQSFEPYPVLEHVKLDPHWRLVMQRNLTNRHTFTAEIKAPEDHGIFKFVITLHRRWWTGVWQEMIAPVRNFRHDDHPRFLPLAIPYYMGCFVTIGLLIVCCALYTQLNEKKKTA